jgi:VanZ family protein
VQTTPASRTDAARRRIGLGLTGLTLAVTALVTLYPFHFHLATASWGRIDWRLYYPGHSDRDLVQNLVMLAPLGAGLVLVRFTRIGAARIAFEAGALGLATALLVETLQIFERARFPQAADVWRNAVGCVVGALVTAGVLTMLDRARHR